VGTGPRADSSPRTDSPATRGRSSLAKAPSLGGALGSNRGPSEPRSSPPNPHKPRHRRSGGMLRTPGRAGRVARATTRVVSQATDMPAEGRSGLGRCRLDPDSPTRWSDID